MKYNAWREHIESCKTGYEYAYNTELPMIKEVFGIDNVQFEVVDTSDLNYRFRFNYNGCIVSLQYVSACGCWWCDVVVDDDLVINRLGLKNGYPEKMCEVVKNLIDMIDM